MRLEPSSDGFKYCFVVPSTYLLFRRGGCVFASGNTGKTVSVLWAFHYLKSIGEVDFMIVTAPLSALERAWGDEVFRNFFDLSFAVVHGPKEKRLKLLAEDKDIYIINHDGISRGPKDAKGRRSPSDILKVLLQKLKHRKGLVVIDELAVFRNSTSDRWWSANQLVQPAEFVWGLTGTPIPNDPTDAWAQCRLLTPHRVPPYFGKFREMVMRQVRDHKWVAKEDALKTVYDAMQPAVRYSREQCIDLPPTTYITRHVELSVDQRRMYKEMFSKFKSEYAGGQLTAVNEASKRAKLLQIVCGVAYAASGDMEIQAPERVALVEELIEQAGAKVIVFVPLTGALEYVARELGKNYTVAVVNGEVSKAKRDQIFHDFQKAKDPHVLVAQPGTMSHSLTLTAANTIIWYAPIDSNEIYMQANARVPRPGQKLNTLIAHIEGSAMERKMYDKLMRQGTTQGILLEMFEEEET